LVSEDAIKFDMQLANETASLAYGSGKLLGSNHVPTADTLNRRQYLSYLQVSRQGHEVVSYNEKDWSILLNKRTSTQKRGIYYVYNQTDP